jgi:uncharacterized membrane protein
VTVRGPLAWILAVVLLLSLAINVLIAGFVLGRLHGPPPGDDFQHIVGMLVRPYPPEIQRAIMDDALAHRDELRRKFDAMRDARREAFDAMRADPFDQAKLDAAYADVRAAADAMQQAIQRIETTAVADAPADVRHQIKPPRGPFP